MGHHRVGLEHLLDPVGKAGWRTGDEPGDGAQLARYEHLLATGAQRVDDRVGHGFGLDDPGAAGLLEPADHLGPNQAGHHDRGADAGAARLGANGPGEADDGVLGGRVGGAAGRGDLPGRGGQVHEVAAVPGSEAPQGKSRSGEYPTDVDVEQSLSVAWGFVDEQADRRHSGVVDQYVERPDSCFGFGQERLEAAWVADVEWQSDHPRTELCGDGRARDWVEVAYHDRHSRP